MGLRLHKAPRTRSRSSRSVVVTKKKKQGQIKTTYRKIQRNFKLKIRKDTLGISFFEQSPSFATNHLVSVMNSQRFLRHVQAHLAGPA
jgi:hypothetical protein